MATRNIYIVDDDHSIRATLRLLLSAIPNLMVFAFRSGDEFYEQIDELEPGCVLLDYDMPGLNGVEVLRVIQALPGKFGAIVVTGRGTTAIAVQAWKLGALDFLEKPCEPALLLKVIDEAFATIEESGRVVALAQRARNAIARLSAREKSVLEGLVEGRSNKAIAHDLNISPRTVEIYRANLMAKLHARSLADVLQLVISAGMLL